MMSSQAPLIREIFNIDVTPRTDEDSLPPDTFIHTVVVRERYLYQWVDGDRENGYELYTGATVPDNEDVVIEEADGDIRAVYTFGHAIPPADLRTTVRFRDIYPALPSPGARRPDLNLPNTPQPINTDNASSSVAALPHPSTAGALGLSPVSTTVENQNSLHHPTPQSLPSQSIVTPPIAAPAPAHSPFILASQMRSRRFVGYKRPSALERTYALLILPDASLYSSGDYRSKPMKEERPKRRLRSTAGKVGKAVILGGSIYLLALKLF